MSGLFQIPSRMEDLALFTRHLAGAMDARAPLPEVLRAYAAEAEPGAFVRAVEALAGRVESGVELSAAMEESPEVFPGACRRLVRLGEQGRALGGVMRRLADSLEDGLKTYEYFRRAAIYPTVILILLFLNFTFLTSKVLPRVRAVAEQIGWQPGGALGLLASGSSLPWLVMTLFLLVPIAFLVASLWGLRIRGMSYGRWQLGLPLIGAVLRRAETARFSGNLALLLENRIPMAESLGLVADSSENRYVRAAIEDFRRRFESGEKLSDLIASQTLFPPSMAVMVASAEDQGGLAVTLRSLSNYYAERTSHGLTVMREVFEPLMLLLIGLLVALVMIGLYAPMFALPALMPL